MMDNRYTFLTLLCQKENNTERISYERLSIRKQGINISFPRQAFFFRKSVPVSILTSVSKKRFKRAVKRNLIKRQVREAYRIQKQELCNCVQEKGKSLKVAFIYIDKEIYLQKDIEKAMAKALRVLKEKME